MDKLLFIYDDLMTLRVQTLTSIPIQLITPAQLSAKMYWVTDTKKKRPFLIPESGVSTKIVYGGVFLLKEYEHFQHKLHSYYNNSIPFTTRTIKEDLFDLQVVKPRPIRFSGLKELQRCKYEIGEEVDCECFVGNGANHLIWHCMQRRKYYKLKNINATAFIEMVKENMNGE